MEARPDFDRGVRRQKASAADAKFGVALAGEFAANQFRGGPDAAAVLPAAAGAGEPFAENRTRGNETAFVLRQRTGQGSRLAGGAHHHGNQRRQQVSRDGQTRAFRDAVDVADDFEAEAGADDAGEKVLQRFAGAFDTRRHDARGDDSGFEEAEVIAGEVEDFVEVGDVSGRAEVNAGEAQHRLVNDTQIRLDRRARRGVASVNAEVNRDIEDARAFGKIHAEEEDVGPTAVREVHADRGSLTQERERGAEKFGSDAERLVGGMTDAEHPLVAADRADAAADLVGERLEPEVVIGGSERAGDAVGRRAPEEDVNGFLEAAVEEMFVPGKRHQAGARQFFGQVEPVHRVEKEECPDTLVKIIGLTAELVERGSLSEKRVERRLPAEGVEGLVARRGVGGGDDGDKPAHASFCLASSSTSCVRTSLRSAP